MSAIIGDTKCPKCAEQGRDKTGNHLLLFEDGNGYCSRCSYFHDGSKGKLKPTVRSTLSPEEIAERMAEIQECPIQELKSRSISHAVAERYGVRVGLSFEDGTTQATHFYPKTQDGEITAYKVRRLDKKMFWSVGDGKGCELFGLEQAKRPDVHRHTVWVAEDELSAMSIYQALTMHSKAGTTYKPAVVSLPDGVDESGHKVTEVFDRSKNFLKNFDEVVICFDNDKAGNISADAVRSLIPDRAKFVEFPTKDANDMLMEGRHYELYNLVRFTAEAKSPDGAVDAVDLIEEALIPPKMGLSTCWPGLDDVVKGQRWHEFTVIGGGSSIG